MFKTTVPLFEPGSPVTFFNHLDKVEMLIRSADWYQLPPITRYLLNVAAAEIRMADAKTEIRVYSHERFNILSELLDRAPERPADVAHEAWAKWSDEEHEFGIVHIELDGERKGELILGDDPMDVNAFITDKSDEAWEAMLRRIDLREFEDFA